MRPQEINLHQEPDTKPARKLASAWDYFRLVAALVVTPSVLVYHWGRALVIGMMDGTIEAMTLAILGGSIAVVMLLTWNLSSRFAQTKFEQFVPSVVGTLWVAVTSLIIWLYSGELIPRWIVLLLFVPSTFWVVWLAWMLYRPWAWRYRLSILLLCAGLVVPFPTLLRAAGLTGDARPNFVWRRTAAAPRAAAVESAIVNSLSDADSVRLETTGFDYPQYLGPRRTGVLPDSRLSADWTSRPPREVWRSPVGDGWGAFSVVGDLAFTQEQRDAYECVTCCRVSDGKRVWVHEYPARFDSSVGGSNMGGTGPRATPTIAEGRVYAVGATGILNCLEGATGKVIWSADIQQDNDGKTISHGVCGSPLIAGELVIVAPTGNDAACLAAYDRDTGKRAWRAGKHAASYGSPALVELAGRSQILLYTNDGLEAHDPQNGEFLWNFTWTNHVRVNCSQPLIVDATQGLVLLCTGYDNGSVLLDVDPGDTTWSVREVWKSPREMKTKFTTAVRLGDQVYGLDEGILACIDLATGKRRWKGGRYQHGQVLLAGELLLVQAESGEVILVRPDPDRLVELARLPALSGKTWNNLALAGRFLLVRNDHEAACFELPLAEQP